MIYLDNAATSLPKGPGVAQAVTEALRLCGNPGRGGHRPAMAAAEKVFQCREEAAKLFACQPEQVVFTASCTQGLNTAIQSLVQPGDRVAVSGFEHNAVIRSLYALGAEIAVFGRKVFDPNNTLEELEAVLKTGVKAAAFTHASNVFGYILPVTEMAEMCRKYGVPFLVDAAQSAGILPVTPEIWDADFVAMPGHKGLLGPQGTGILICRKEAKPLLYGGTGGDSRRREMPDFLPDRLEAGTLNVPGIAGLTAGLHYVNRVGTDHIREREHAQLLSASRGLQKLGYRVFTGKNQLGVLSFLGSRDVEEDAHAFAKKGIALRAGLHCAPLAHETVGTTETGTLRLSFGYRSGPDQTRRFLDAAAAIIQEG